MQGADDYPHQLSEVLVEEVELIKGPTFVTDAYGTIVNLPQAVETAGSRVGPNPTTIEDERRRTFYFWAHRFNLSALCLSGGGIRSASFALGVIQALADGSLLKQFDYLSTVSGGGYIGSWLSAWLYRNGDADDVIRQLRSRREAVDAEPGAITHLRDYSNYLTPRLGLFSADTWSAVAIILRNLLINWLILLPAIALPDATRVRCPGRLLGPGRHPSAIPARRQDGSAARRLGGHEGRGARRTAGLFQSV